ncbi:oligopeptide transport system ATP-binding protein [Sporanaerobacter acetigenes DSM 13106]|uniref:Oligopeptide transport system ATP-binding protein n=2 Tax=Sporanaerobacter acetigenes TaxID=165813 RepID=A0A1M5WGP8_9FIRM|nr:ABC transporter ATP-binding protein [Sporanaerobacter acetigenes]SHH86374.1 oligopeptide transport system ATP-binding protein [Sporanaerobacter acetigenes DSM 13106]
MMRKEKLLEINNLEVSFLTDFGKVNAVRGISFNVSTGETLGIVGESGCGKSVTALSILKLLEPSSAEIEGKIAYNQMNITNFTDSEMEKIRGAEISMVFQDPMSSLNPTMKIGHQLFDTLIKHEKSSRKEAKKTVLKMLESVGINDVETVFNKYPHELSGGMQQRIMIGIALICKPKLLIADEPTTSLDVTIQAQLLSLMKDLKNKLNTSIILITHDLGVVANMADRILVMYAGKIVESGTVEDIFYHPKHPYTVALLGAIPRMDLGFNQKLLEIKGYPPDLIDMKPGCAFAKRCMYSMVICDEAEPLVFECGDEHFVSCWLQHEYSPKIEKYNS